MALEPFGIGVGEVFGEILAQERGCRSITSLPPQLRGIGEPSHHSRCISARRSNRRWLIARDWSRRGARRRSGRRRAEAVAVGRAHGRAHLGLGAQVHAQEFRRGHFQRELA